MMGNVSEWTKSVVVRETDYGMVIEGGSYLLPGEESASVNYRRILPSNTFSQDIGFRIIFDSP